MVIMLSPASAFAQWDNVLFPTDNIQPEALGEVTETPVCFNIVNEAGYTTRGTVLTNYFIRPDGVKSRHRSNFRLKPNESTEFCSSGPFYEGRKVDLVLRAVLPIFECRTAITGDIIIKGNFAPDSEEGTKTWAECLE